MTKRSNNGEVLSNNIEGFQNLPGGFQNLHSHTTYCDGALSAEKMVEAAIQKGCGSIGFSEHSYVSFEKKYSMSLDDTQKYKKEINTLKKKYKGTIEIFLGVEQDYFSEGPAEGFDFIIGTSHYISLGGQYETVDAGSKNQKSIAEQHFGGDFIRMAEAYFETVAGITGKMNADIIGHFDLITKYNFAGSLFDETHPRYVTAAMDAMLEILKKCRLFEVNTGAMYRLGKPEPYPSEFLLRELCKRGGEVILSSDSHDAQSLGHNFGDMRRLLNKCGFKCIKRLTENGFIDEKLD